MKFEASMAFRNLHEQQIAFLRSPEWNYNDLQPSNLLIQFRKIMQMRLYHAVAFLHPINYRMNFNVFTQKCWRNKAVDTGDDSDSGSNNETRKSEENAFSDKCFQTISLLHFTRDRNGFRFLYFLCVHVCLWTVVYGMREDIIKNLHAFFNKSIFLISFLQLDSLAV